MKTTIEKTEKMESLLLSFFGNEKNASQKIASFLKKEGKLKNDLASNLSIMNKELNDCHEIDFDFVLQKWSHYFLNL